MCMLALYRCRTTIVFLLPSVIFPKYLFISYTPKFCLIIITLKSKGANEAKMFIRIILLADDRSPSIFDCFIGYLLREWVV